jgi:transposase InsO family protein
MIDLLISIFAALASTLRTRASLQVEILALRHQLVVLQRSNKKRLRLRTSDRILWVLLSRFWSPWRECLLLVRSDTVIAWHRKGFQLYWNWKSRRGRIGRPGISREICELIRNMSASNVLWGAPRLHGELLKLGIELSQATVAKNMVKHRKPPSQTWRTFLENHVKQLVSVDFFVVPTLTFRILYVFLVLAHDRRRIVHFNMTEHPTAEWTTAQLVQAFPWDKAPRFLLRDRDSIYGAAFQTQAKNMNIHEVLTAFRSPWQSPYVERLIGSIRRECLDHLVIMNERSLRCHMVSYLDYYHGSRSHLSLGKDSPDGRAVQPPETGEISAVPKVGGLHHRYERRAA